MDVITRTSMPRADHCRPARLPSLAPLKEASTGDLFELLADPGSRSDVAELGRDRPATSCSKPKCSTTRLIPSTVIRNGWCDMSATATTGSELDTTSLADRSSA